MRARPPLLSGVTTAPLPIDSLLPAIRDTLAEKTRLVLVAPPGAGKTTGVPPVLLNAPWLMQRRIVMLEPRRLAARAAARRMAAMRGEAVGDTVGYRVHLDTKVGPRTRIEVVTEGVLTRMLQRDPTLSDVGVILFDEFHERSLHADLGLALTLHAQRLVRDDLRLVVMSATLDGRQVAATIDAPVLVAEGRAFHVDTHYRSPRERERVEDAVVWTIHDSLASDSGDILVFLPGGAEIRRTADRLSESFADPRVDIRPLYGDLSGEEQDAAIAPSPAGRRKVVLATNIAETSLTIEGVRVVIDSGLARAPRYSPRTGLTRLQTVRISRASANQRCGRAGRTGPGVCYRLWHRADDAQLIPQSTPGILDADLAPLALELAAAGIDDPAELTWLDAPPSGALAEARTLLRLLGALESAERPVLTAHGRELAMVTLHPRLAHMVLRGRAMRKGALACNLAALLSHRDPLRSLAPGRPVGADVRERLAALANEQLHLDARVDSGALSMIRREARQLRQRFGESAPREQPGDNRVDASLAGTDETGTLLALAYPDRIARRRPGGDGRFLLANGTGARFDRAQALADEEWIVVAETDGASPEARIFLAAPVTLERLLDVGASQLTATDEVGWDEASARVRARRVTRLGAIVVREQELRDVPHALVCDALLGAVRERGIEALHWTDGARQLRERLAFLHHHDAAWPDVSEAALLSSLDAWLAPQLADAGAISDLQRVDLGASLRSLLSWKQLTQIDALAPTHIDVPSGSRIPVDYSNPDAPTLAVRLQEVFGCENTPSVFGGRVPLTLHLLSPAQRPVQVTRNLGAFWRGSYAEVRKEMRGRYPRHEWPEDPAHATPTRRRKPHP
jgi:ATP-dependent helicase HrpB